MGKRILATFALAGLVGLAGAGCVDPKVEELRGGVLYRPGICVFQPEKGKIRYKASWNEIIKEMWVETGGRRIQLDYDSVSANGTLPIASGSFTLGMEDLNGHVIKRNYSFKDGKLKEEP
jgi:hypothetical protein